MAIRTTWRFCKDEYDNNNIDVVTTAELAQHKTPQDCWVELYGEAYDFAPNHMAGPKFTYQLAGRRMGQQRLRLFMIGKFCVLFNNTKLEPY
jgi:hypothetical protein